MGCVSKVVKATRMGKMIIMREYDRYDPFIIAERVRQVYYAPYPLRRDKAVWLVVIKTKPVGRVEVENQGSRFVQGCGSQPSSRTPSPSPQSSSPSISRLRLRDSSTEADALSSAHASDSSEDDDPDDVRYDHYHRIIIRPEGNEFIPNNEVTKIITDILASLYLTPYPTWSDFPESLVEQMFNQFKTKCSWEDQYNREICKNWEYKCRKRLSDSFSTARRVKKKPSWVLPHIWVDLEKYWTTNKFKKQSEQGKKARTSEKGGSLHCLGLRSMGDTRRHLVIP
uniref:Uncharacterized protein n=1 Tax=Nicotiana tabacum TaxID=4097 RepID=A0A1S4BY40_TOBAC|nr:PREDICTED: uncharacterized protein LOC107813119 [Nicotiana tabacum]